MRGCGLSIFDEPFALVARTVAVVPPRQRLRLRPFPPLRRHRQPPCRPQTRSCWRLLLLIYTCGFTPKLKTLFQGFTDRFLGINWNFLLLQRSRHHFRLLIFQRLHLLERSHGLSADANRLHALRYLLVQLLLQVLLRLGDYSEAASELVICCKKAFSAFDLPWSSGEDDLEVDDAPQLMDVLVDTLLSLLPQSSAPMRSSIEQRLI